MPESRHVEYKRQQKDDLLKWLCAFATQKAKRPMHVDLIESRSRLQRCCITSKPSTP